MYYVELRRIVFCVLAFVLLFNSTGNVLAFDGDQPDYNSSSENLTRDIVVGQPTWCILQSTTPVYLAPYGADSSPSGHTLSAGTGVYVISRDYNCFYVLWYIDGKEMFGYVPMSCINFTNYVWTQYDVYRPGSCTGTTTVVAGSGTTNTYVTIGQIVAGQSPILILGQRTNTYNNKLYYFIQYLDANGLPCRGWIDSTLGTVTINEISTYDDFKTSNELFIVNKATEKVLAWDPTTNKVVQQNMVGGPYQIFRFEPTYYNGVETGFF